MNAALKLEEATLLPSAVELERAVLGALMIAPLIHEVGDLLAAKMFYDPAHAKVFQCIVELGKRGDPVDIWTVSQEAKSHGWLAEIGGMHYVSTLTNGIASGANIRAHAFVIVRQFIAREIVSISHEARRAAVDPTANIFDVLGGAQMDLSRLNELGAPTERNAAEVAREVVDNKFPDRGQETGYPALDVKYRHEPGTMTIVGARPGMGKTAFMMGLAWRSACMGINPFIASMEMKDRGLVNRLICGECGIPVWQAKRGKLSDRQDMERATFYQTRHKELESILIDESPSLDTQSLLARVERAKRKHGTGIVFVDYLQLMNVRGERFKSRYERVTAVSEQLRIIAKQTDLPFVVLSQLSRQAAGKPGEKAVVRRPAISDLRESGQIEQDAEAILLLHRPAYYDQEAGNELEVIVAKNRDGADGPVELAFDAEGVRVVDAPAFATPPRDIPGPDNRIEKKNDEPF